MITAALVALGVIAVVLALLGIAGFAARIAEAVDTIAREAVEQRQMTQRAADQYERAKADYEEARRQMHTAYGDAARDLRAAEADLYTRTAMIDAKVSGRAS